VSTRRLVQDLTLARNAVLLAEKISPKRAFIEAGGYVDALFAHPHGRHVVIEWREEFRSRLRALDQLRIRLGDRSRRLMQTLNPRLAPLRATNKLANDCVEWMSQIDTRFGLLGIAPPGHAVPFGVDDLVAMQWSNLELAIFVLSGDDPAFDRLSVAPIFQESIDAGDAGAADVLVREFNVARNTVLAQANSRTSWLHPRPTLDAIQRAGSLTNADLLSFLLRDMPLAFHELKREGIDPAVPQLSYYRLLGGSGAERLRNASLLPGPRHCWYALAELISLSLFVETDTSILIGDSDLLRATQASIVATNNQQQSAEKRAQKLALELVKVHEGVNARIQEGRLIHADLERYRQRMQYYDHTTLQSLVRNAGSGTKLKKREEAAVRHLATWLADRGYTPLSKNLGRSRTDIDAHDIAGAFVIEAKILTDATAPASQSVLDAACLDWASQAIDYADGQGLQLAFVVVFNATKNRSFVAAPEPFIIGNDRLALHYILIPATDEPPSRAKGATLTLRWNAPLQIRAVSGVAKATRAPTRPTRPRKRQKR
jgi:hypothetical protein